MRDVAPERSGSITFDPAAWTPGRRELLWRSPLDPYQGFGVAARGLLLASERAGIDVGLSTPPGPAAPDFARFVRRWDARGRIGLAFAYLPRPDPIPAALRVVVTMREGTLVPPEHIDALNRTATLVYLPCRQNLEAFRACGLRPPSKVLPFGVDPARFPLLERHRDPSASFTFGTFGELSSRKGIDVLIRAFRAEFRPNEPVRLLLKTIDAPVEPSPDDPRIEVVAGFWDHDRLLGFLRRLDAFVLPSRGEGFGLCGLEAMATGLPLIATNWGGPADYLDPADSCPLAFWLVDAATPDADGGRLAGQWAEPDEEHFRLLLRRLFADPDAARAMGRRAAARVRSTWTWDRAARQLRDDLDLLAAGATPA